MTTSKTRNSGRESVRPGSDMVGPESVTCANHRLDGTLRNNCSVLCYLSIDLAGKKIGSKIKVLGKETPSCTVTELKEMTES